VATLRVEDKATVRKHDLARGVSALVKDGPFDLVLVHPPFNLLKGAPPPGSLDVAVLLGSIATAPGLLTPDARIAFETPRNCYREAADLPELEIVRRKEYGSTALFVAAARSPSPQLPLSEGPG
jgi:16S rRNA G966 N2-methylase RsmD